MSTIETPSSPHEAPAIKILKAIEKYGLNYERTGVWDGLSSFVPTVTQQVERQEKVLLLLPGFPFKSPNFKEKVLGVLPDLGEELALKHLNGLCDTIASVYEHGAEVHICSDGLVYNDLLGVSDETVWNYGEGVRQIAADNNLQHLKFIRLWDLLEHPGDWSKDFYLANASNIRRELQDRYRDPEFEADMATKSDSDMQMTHKKYLEFLKKDLALNPEHQARSPEEKITATNNIAKAMMGRWKAYATALEAKRTGYVRLSIHDSGGAGKLSMALIPQPEKGALGSTPWHSAIVMELDGSYRTAPSNSVVDTHELVYRNGQPYYYRAKSDLFDWTSEGLNVSFEPQYPSGLIIRSLNDTPTQTSTQQLPTTKIILLSSSFSPIIFRGFNGSANDESVLHKAPTSPMRFCSSRLFFRFLPQPWTAESLENLTFSSSDGSKRGLRLVQRHPISKRPSITLEGQDPARLVVENGDQSVVEVVTQGLGDIKACVRISAEEEDFLTNDSFVAVPLELEE